MLLAFGEIVLAVVSVALAALTLADRHLVRACAYFVGFALTVSLTWWRLDFPRLALLEGLLGAVLTSLFLFHALGVTVGDVRVRGRPSRWCDPVSITWPRGLAALLPVLATLGMLGLALSDLGLPSQPQWLAAMAMLGLGLWAFALHRHLLRRLLAFNVIGTGIFLLLMTLVSGTSPVSGQGLVAMGLVVALLGTALGAVLIRRLKRLGGRPPEAPAQERES